MRCRRCRACVEKGVKTMVYDIMYGRYRNPLFCNDCNRIVAWKYDKECFPRRDRQFIPSIIDCEVVQNNPYISSYINHVIHSNYEVCELTFTDASKLVVYPLKYENDYIYAVKDAWNDGGNEHRPTAEQYRIPICDVIWMHTIDIHADWFVTEL